MHLHRVVHKKSFTRNKNAARATYNSKKKMTANDIDDALERGDADALVSDTTSSGDDIDAGLDLDSQVLASMPLHEAGVTMTAYHPDFLFCGECTSCNVHPPEDPSPTDIRHLDRILNIPSPEQDGGSIRTKVMVDDLSCPSQILVIQSLLTELSGVSKVIVNLEDKLVFVDHDATTPSDHLVETLQEMGYTARLENDPSLSNSSIVRSQLYVQGICCASECPAINKIVKPLRGVNKLQISITTKMVYVFHDASLIDVHEIAMALFSQGFQARVVKDGASQKPHSASVGRTTIHANQVLTIRHVQPIQHILLPIKGVKRVGVNVAESVIYIEHNVSLVSAQRISSLIAKICANTIAADAQDEIVQRAATAMSVAPSKYVASTLTITNLTLRHVPILEKALHQNYIRAQLRAFYPHVPSKTLKLEHDPRLLQADAVAALLKRFGLEAWVNVDGAVEHLALPLMEDYDTPRYGGMDKEGSSFPHLNVILSGFFWFLSTLSFIGGNWYVQ
jgi:copper ion binding protein